MAIENSVEQKDLNTENGVLLLPGPLAFTSSAETQGRYLEGVRWAVKETSRPNEASTQREKACTLLIVVNEKALRLMGGVQLATEG